MIKKQIRIYVPYSDFKLYQTAKKYNKPYKQFLIDNGLKWLKRFK